jgi:hypothetical protein
VILHNITCKALGNKENKENKRNNGNNFRQILKTLNNCVHYLMIQCFIYEREKKERRKNNKYKS